MIVLGDRHSANTRRLYEISASLCANALLAEDAADLNGAADRWRGAQKIGITAGASTPAWIIKEVTEMMSEATKFETEAGENFAEMLEGSLKTLNTGDKVTGIVTQIGQTEIHVDLGVKQSGYIPISEMSDDPAYKVKRMSTSAMRLRLLSCASTTWRGPLPFPRRRWILSKGGRPSSRPRKRRPSSKASWWKRTRAAWSPCPMRAGVYSGQPHGYPQG